MRLLLALLLLALPGLAGRAPLAQPTEQRSQIAPADGHLAQYLRGAESVRVRADAPRPSTEGANRSATHSVVVPHVAPALERTLLARGSPLERGFRDAARGAHLPYYSLAPPAR